MRHYTLEELEDFKNGKLGWFQKLRCKYHLKRCALCHDNYQILLAEDQFLSDVRKQYQKYAPENLNNQGQNHV